MAVTANSVITAQTPYAVNFNGAALTACTTRGPTASASLAGANIVVFVPTSTNGVRVDSVSFKGCSTSVTAPTAAQVITIWEFDGTTAFPLKEILVPVVTPSTTAASWESGDIQINKTYPSTHALYVSTTITTTASTTAFCGTAIGGLL